MTKEDAVKILTEEASPRWKIRADNHGWREDIIILTRQRKGPSESGKHYGQLLCRAEIDQIAISCPCAKGMTGKAPAQYAVRGTVNEAIKKITDHSCEPWGA